MIVAELAALFSIQLNRKSIAEANFAMRSLRATALGMGAFFGAKMLGKGLIGFNAEIEDAKNQIAGMLSLAKKTEFTDELVHANTLYENLRRRAAELPGSTADYINVLGFIAQPLARAKTDLKTIEDLTINTFLAAKGLKEPWQAAARDISEFISVGRFGTVDKFLRRMLEPMGFVGEEGRKRAKRMSMEERRDLIARALTQKQITDMSAAQAKSFTGRFEKMKEAGKQFLGEVGKPLFEALKDGFADADEWLKKNKASVDSLAKSIGGGLATGFNILRTGIEFLVDHGDFTESVLFAIGGAFTFMGVRAGLAWAAAMGPLVPFVAALGGAYYLFQKLRDELGDVPAAIAAAFAVAAVWKFVDGVKTAVRWVVALNAVSKGGAAAGAAAGGASAAAGAGARAGAGSVAGAGLRAGAGVAGLGAAGAGLKKTGLFGRAAAGASSLAWPVAIALMTDGIIDSLQDSETTARGNASLSTLWSTLDIGEAMKTARGETAGAGNVSVNIGDTTIQVSGADLAIEALKKKQNEEMAALLRAAGRNTGGNRA